MAGGINPNARLSAPRANQAAAPLVITIEASSGPSAYHSWPPLVGAQAAGPAWIGISQAAPSTCGGDTWTTRAIEGGNDAGKDTPGQG